MRTKTTLDSCTRYHLLWSPISLEIVAHIENQVSGAVPQLDRLVQHKGLRPCCGRYLDDNFTFRAPF